jgi:DnaJ-class molecular chaperone
MSNLEEMGKSQQSAKPHACPVCGGRGKVPLGFYVSQNPQMTTGGTGTEMCKSCSGSGLVWG